MDLEFLDAINQKKVTEIAEKHSFEPKNTFLRFWDKNTVQIDGDLTLDELKTLVEIMEVIKGANVKLTDGLPPMKL